MFTGKDEMWEDYINHFQGVTLWNRWGSEDKAEWLYLALDGSAANYLYSLCVRQLLCEFVHHVRNPLWCHQECCQKRLEERHREKVESYADLGQIF